MIVRGAAPTSCCAARSASSRCFSASCSTPGSQQPTAQQGALDSGLLVSFCPQAQTVHNYLRLPNCQQSNSTSIQPPHADMPAAVVLGKGWCMGPPPREPAAAVAPAVLHRTFAAMLSCSFCCSASSSSSCALISLHTAHSTQQTSCMESPTGPLYDSLALSVRHKAAKRSSHRPGRGEPLWAP